MQRYGIGRWRGMDERVVSPGTARDIRTTIAAEKAAQMEVEQRIRNADRFGKAFATKVIIPSLRSAEARLGAAKVRAGASAHFEPRIIRCLLTVVVDKDDPPETLTFEVMPGAAVPHLRWTVGGIAHDTEGMEAAKVEEIVQGFAEDVLKANVRRQ
jgi:hypothetical protein